MLKPFSRLVVEEEWEEAHRLKKTVLLFLQDGSADKDSLALRRRLSDYVSGYFRSTFSSAAELKTQINKALTQHSEELRRPIMSLEKLDLALKRSFPSRNVTSMRIVVQPNEEFEFIDPRLLNSEDFNHSVLEIAHSREISLFSFKAGVDSAARADAIELNQSFAPGVSGASLIVHESGLIVVDVPVDAGPGFQTDSYAAMTNMVVAEEEIQRRVAQALTFCTSLFAKQDPFERIQRFHFNVALYDLGYKQIEKSPKARSSFSMSIMGGNGPIFAYAEPRLIGRSDLNNPTEEAERAVALIGRQANQR